MNMARLSYREQAYQLILNKLVNNEFSSGDKIREDLLAMEFNMSRTPVREAINRLTANGLVTDIPMRGVFARGFSNQDLLELIKVRESLEILAVRECIDRASEDDVEELKNILDEFHAAQQSDDIQEQNRLDALFHKRIAQFSGNTKLISFINELEDCMRIARAAQDIRMMSNNKERSYQQHLAIYEAIRDRNEDAAELAVKTNVRGMIEKLHI